jgi:hypothetical protein
MSDASFTAVADLIRLVVDAKACAQRVEELRKLVATATAAQAKLNADSASHVATKAALDEREAAVTERERIVTAWEREASERGEREKYPFDPNLGRGSKSWSGLVRE